ncbi:YbhB/YbcL family Raf kinase inhibitor-like protein [Amycolatopsis silviterrae]|uniref:YbhB/YbcL family Raf kinase inhibitor-like protein n=1 Tax=Amycolatopsis silviterrae TaxID=1656914 RepID=A0ABW5H2L6_9PSEU
MRRTRIALFALLVLCAASLSPAAASASTGRNAFALSSTAFADGGLIPKAHDCASSGDGDPRKKNESPPLDWSGGPDAAKSYAIVMHDLDNGIIHWVIYDIPVAAAGLPRNVDHAYQPSVPAGSRQAYYRGSANFFGYQGPCTTNHTYEWAVHALNRATLSELNSNSSTRVAKSAINAATIATASLRGDS